MLRKIVAITPLLLACALGAGASRGLAANPPAPAVASADFPYDLQGLAGRDDGVMASLREKKTGKSVWVSRGEKAGEYALESADAAKGTAVFSKGGVTIRVTLATPAPPEEKAKSDPVRNAAVEKGMVNDSRQISSAANQYFAEHSTKSVTLAQLRTYLSESNLTNGLKITVTAENGPRTAAFNSKDSDNFVLREDATFVLTSDDYDKTLSTNERVLPAGTAPKDTRGGEQGIEFKVGTGEIIR